MTDLIIDIDEPWILPIVIKRILKMGFLMGEMRETEKGYHIKLPVQCNADNFIYCFVVRRYALDDSSRIVGDVIRLSQCEDPKLINLYINRYFDFKVKNGYIVQKQRFKKIYFPIYLNRFETPH